MDQCPACASPPEEISGDTAQPVADPARTRKGTQRPGASDRLMFETTAGGYLNRGGGWNHRIYAVTDAAAADPVGWCRHDPSRRTSSPDLRSVRAPSREDRDERISRRHGKLDPRWRKIYRVVSGGAARTAAANPTSNVAAGSPA